MLQKKRYWQSALLPLTAIALASVNFVAPLAADEPPILPSPPGAGGRGDICVLAPNRPGAPAGLWSDRPLLLWQGSVSRIEVTAGGNGIWFATPDPTDQSLLYSGRPLQPDQVYRWRIFQGNAVIYNIPFQLIDLEERAAIDADLATLEAQLVEENATPDQVALGRARVFAARQLWTDTLRELLSIENPDTAIEQYIQAISVRLCG